MQSLRDQVNDLLTEYSSYIHRYFQVLTSIAESANADDKEAEVLVRQICDTDRKLQAALTRIEEHQARQKQILRVQDEIQKHQEALLRMVEQLNETREDLDQELAVASKELEKIKYAEQSNVEFADILSYASKLSKYTSAPPNFDLMSRDMKIGFEKPYPDEERMRRGLLYWQYAGSRPPNQEEQFESSASEASMDERGNKAEQPSDRPTSGEDANQGGDPFWILDLNPDLAS
ncbi:hypothetical protein VTP01DRAFT_3837 [Rhizomucor pusillus]|uniref:uncharacterized protein n=1 Tax=Rhizomucor pusillus TaxID=4840 RepID=UPI0037421333